MKHASILLFILVAPLRLVAAADCEASLATVLSRYVEARGGAVALSRQTALRIKAAYREGEMNARFDFRVKKPHFMRIKATFADGGTYEEGYDGRSAWEKPGEEATARHVGGDAAKALQQSAESPTHVYGLHDMESLAADVTLLGCEVLDATRYYVVNVQSRFGTDIDYYLNASTFRLERARSVRPLHPAQDPTPVTIEERWSDFRIIDGVWRPFSQTQWNVDTGERLSTLTIDTLRIDAQATPADFRMPQR